MISFPWPSISAISLDAIGLVILADITAVAERTVLRGASIHDVAVLCPGLHRQLEASRFNAGEFPACAAMTTGYVFRVENPATVAYLQRIGRTGHLTTLTVSSTTRQPSRGDASSVSQIIATVSYSAATALTVTVTAALIRMQDWWAVSVVLILCAVRLINMTIIQRLTKSGWHGANEPGQSSDLLVLLSYDRWIRIQGMTDDVKAVTSGRWLRDPSALEGSFTAFATLLTYVDAALAVNASHNGKLLLLLLFLGSAALVGLANLFTNSITMNGRTIEVHVGHKAYKRRRDLAEEMIAYHGRDDWAVAMGMVVPKDDPRPSPIHKRPAIM